MNPASPNIVRLHRKAMLLFLIAHLCCVLVGSLTANDETQKTKSQDGLNPFFVAQLEHATKEYKQFGRIDETRMQWSPLLCNRPDPKTIHAGRGSVSESDDSKTHGGKIYFLFVKDRAKYQNRAKEQPFGQILVKESWSYKAAPVEFKPDAKQHRRFDDDVALPIDQIRGGYLPYAEKGGRWYKADQLKELFIMIKLSSDTPETDEGWIYGTVARDGKVTSAGKVESCVNCHQTQKNDRMFFHPDFRTQRPKNPDFSHIRSEPKQKPKDRNRK